MSREGGIPPFQLPEKLRFISLCVATSLQAGVYWCILTILSSILAPLGFTSSDNGWIGALMTGAGTVGSLIATPILDRTKRYKLIFFLTCLFANIALGSLVITTQLYASHWGAIASIAAVGFFYGSVQAEGLEYAAELVFPVLEIVSGTTLSVACNAVGVILDVCLPLYAEAEHSAMIYPLLILVGSSGLGLLLTVILSTQYKKHEFEKNAAVTEKIHASLTGFEKHANHTPV